MMETKLFTKTEQIPEAADILKNGGLLGIPTETVYGKIPSDFGKESL